MFGYRHPYLDPTRVQLALGSASLHQPFGHRLHIIFGLLWCFAVGWPTSLVELAGLPLGVFFLIRTPNIWRTCGAFAFQPLTIAFAALVLWQTLSLQWTPDLKQALKELSANRWIWVTSMLWPVMGRRMWFIGRIAAGFLCGTLSQLLHEIGRQAGMEWLTWPRFPDRNSGWWDPVVGGSLLV